MGLQVAAAGKIINEFTGLAFAGGEFETDNPAIRFVSAEAWTRDAQGAHITFATAPVGTSSPVEGMRLTSEGILLVGTDTASGSAKLQVSGAISVSGITYAGTLALSATGANVITLSTNGVVRQTIASSGGTTFAGNVTASYLGLTNASAANDVTADGLAIVYGADGTLGPLYLALRARPSATGGNRYTALQAGDNLAYRPIALNPSGGSLLVGTTTDDGASKLQVAGNVKITNATSAYHTLVSGSNVLDIATYSAGGAYVQAVGNHLNLGTAANYDIYLLTNSQVMTTISGSGTLTHYNPTAPTGVTSLVVRAGAGQSTNALFNIVANDGTTSVFKALETKIGFFGATPVVKQTVTADAASILAALQAYGLAV